MGLKKSELNKISEMDPEGIKTAIVDLDETDVAKLYDLEVAKSSPRNEVMELLLDQENNDGEETSDPEPVVVKKGEFNPKETHNMVWHKGLKCIMQGKNIFDPISKDKIN